MNKKPPKTSFRSGDPASLPLITKAQKSLSATGKRGCLCYQWPVIKGVLDYAQNLTRRDLIAENLYMVKPFLRVGREYVGPTIRADEAGGELARSIAPYSTRMSFRVGYRLDLGKQDREGDEENRHVDDHGEE